MIKLILLYNKFKENAAYYQIVMTGAILPIVLRVEEGESQFAARLYFWAFPNCEIVEGSLIPKFIKGTQLYKGNSQPIHLPLWALELRSWRFMHKGNRTTLLT